MANVDHKSKERHGENYLRIALNIPHTSVYNILVIISFQQDTNISHSCMKNNSTSQYNKTNHNTITKRTINVAKYFWFWYQVTDNFGSEGL